MFCICSGVCAAGWVYLDFGVVCFRLSLLGVCFSGYFVVCGGYLGYLWVCFRLIVFGLALICLVVLYCLVWLLA